MSPRPRAPRKSDTYASSTTPADASPVFDPRQDEDDDSKPITPGFDMEAKRYYELRGWHVRLLQEGDRYLHTRPVFVKGEPILNADGTTKFATKLVTVDKVDRAPRSGKIIILDNGYKIFPDLPSHDDNFLPIVYRPRPCFREAF